MKWHRFIIALAAAVMLAGAAEATALQARKSVQRSGKSSTQRSSRSRGHSASGGSVQYHRKRRGSDSARRTTPARRTDRARGTSRDQRTDRARRTDQRDRARRSDARRSTPDTSRRRDNASRRSNRVPAISPRVPDQHRHRAASGSLRRHGHGGRPSHLPSFRPSHDVRVRRYPRYGTRITQLPTLRREFMHRGHRYFFCDGVYYRPYPGGYYSVVRPPIGFHLSYLPAGYVSVTIGGRPYYRYEDTYYIRDIVDQQPVYVVVEPPRQIVVDNLPPDVRVVQFRGRTYYVDIYEEVAYAPVIVNGYTQYRLTDLDVDVDIDDGVLEIEIDED